MKKERCASGAALFSVLQKKIRTESAMLKISGVRRNSGIQIIPDSNVLFRHIVP
jgi:hypothetical protein